MRNYFKNIKGETLAETIIALSILAIGITVASSSVLNSIRNMANAKNRVIAVNIAREGIEAMHNIRDTNWLLYSDRRRDCWNNDPNVSPCEGATPLPPGNYVIYRTLDQSWHLLPADSDLASDSNGDGILYNDLDLAPLSLVDIDPTIDSDQDGTADNDPNIYNHANKIIPNTLGPEILKTPFSRYITLEYLDNDGDFQAISQINEPADSINTSDEWKSLGDEDVKKLNRMRITSTVEWARGEAIHKVELKTILTDHLGRSELES